FWPALGTDFRPGRGQPVAASQHFCFQTTGRSGRDPALMDLFSNSPEAPLAQALRPGSLDEVIGQSHLIGPGKPLRLAFESGKPHSMILWGPPGVGKTTLARLTANTFGYAFIALSAVFAGVKEIRSSMEQAEQNLALGKKTILFVDEIHRFNKS